MKRKWSLPLFLLLLSLPALACGGGAAEEATLPAEATPTEQPAEPPTEQPTEAPIDTPLPAPTKAPATSTSAPVDDFDARYASKLITLDEANALAHSWAGGWSTTDPPEARYDDGLCRVFQLEGAPQFALDNCIFDRSDDYNVAVLRDFYAQTSPSVDLTDKSAYTYDADDYFVYGYHESSGLPKYLLLLERDGFVLGASITTRNFALGEAPFSAFYANDEFALDDLLHEVMLVNLDRLSAQPTTAEVFVQARIVFASDRDGNPEIYAVNTDGSDLTRLTENPTVDVEPAWSPDGRRIAFVSDRDGNPEIYSMNPDGSDVTRLTDDSSNDFSPVWSPNSQLIAFMSERSGNPDIHLMNADGSEETPFIADASLDLSPAFSYTTQELAFVSNRAGAFDLYIANSTGEARRVTEGLGDVLTPDWSPNGRFIVFAANPGGSYDIYIIRPDGSDLQQVSASDVDELRPRWSPDSNYIMYTTGQGQQSEILITDESGAVLRVTDNDAADSAPAWGPMD